MRWVIKNYKKSKYNIFVPYKNGTIVFNCLSGAIGNFDDDTLTRYENENLNEKEIEILLQKGILIDKDYNELDKINCDRCDGIKGNNFKHFRIWPTSACNARCYYCFEKGIIHENMSLETAEKVVKFIDDRLNNNDILKIEWFGGEPLLKTDIIDFIYDKLKKICKDKNCSLYSSIISNGSLVDEKLAYKMKNEWEIGRIQITLDGYEKEYNDAKNYCNPKKYNFKTVINSIKYLANQGMHVTIRMNYDTSNYESLCKLINYLHDELIDYKNISYYVYPLWSSIEENAEGSFSSNAQADDNLLKLFELLVKNKMGSVSNIARLNYKQHSCQAWSENSLTILPDGKISKCCESYNQTLGDVDNGITNKESYKFWVNPNLDEKCIECVYLPLCQGGCKASHFSRMPQCIAYKPIFTDILKWYVDHLEKQREKMNTKER